MERKLVAIGNSLAVTLPADLIKQLGLSKGDSVDLSVHPVTGAIAIRPGPSFVDGGAVTARVRNAAKQLAKRRAGAYRELAK